jgi:glycosyltransferase involved in cell wall biosynthesis
VFVSDEVIKRQIASLGIEKIKITNIGVDTDVFVPKVSEPTGRAIYVGKITNSSGLGNFLEANIPFRKVVIGDGKSRHKLSQRYPDIEFLGWMTGELLVRQYQTCDIVVNPSKVNTTSTSFLEAAACGKPYAAFPTESHKLMLGNSNAGYLSDDLSKSCLMSYHNHSKEDSIELAARNPWESVVSTIAKTINEN